MLAGRSVHAAATTASSRGSRVTSVTAATATAAAPAATSSPSDSASWPPRYVLTPGGVATGWAGWAKSGEPLSAGAPEFQAKKFSSYSEN